MIPLRGAAIGLALSLSAALTWWLYAQLQSVAPRPAPPPRHVVDYYAVNFTATAMDDQGNPSHRLEAARLDHYLDDDTSELTRPRLQIFEPDAPRWQVSSDIGWLSSQGKVVRLQDDVRVHRNAGPRTRPVDAYTNWLLIRPDDGFAETDRPVDAISTGLELKSVGMKLYLDQDRLQLLSNVRGTYETRAARR